MARIKGFRDGINFRDLGGYKTQDGRVVKPGLIYRSGGLYRLSDDELTRFKDLGIRFVMDLRTTAESKRHPDPVFEGLKMLRYSGLEFRGGEEIDFSPEGMHRLGDGARDQFEKFTAYYREMPFDNEAFRILFRALEDGWAPLVFHCASGKDRTGVAAMLILLALGVEPEHVLKDYLLSNDYLKSDIANAQEEHAEAIAENPFFEKNILMESGVLEETGADVLAEILRRYPSFEEYFANEFGLAGERLEQLRNAYLV